MKGIVLGVVEDDNGEPHVGFGIPQQSMVVMSVGYAGLLYDQLEAILGNLGYFNDEPTQDIKQVKGSRTMQ